ncbi:MAG: leucine-rich repeat protein, partial [Coriobacteriales bacterium]|nr:leucine-rich repeat protein [Coriobacteriales bacterium]
MSKLNKQDKPAAPLLQRVLSILLVTLLSAGMIPLLPVAAFGVDDESETLIETMQESQVEAVEKDVFVNDTTEAVEPLVNPASVLAGQLFQLTIKTPASGSTFILPTNSSLLGLGTNKSYDWMIDWGDGNIQYATGQSSYNNGVPHTYTVAGAYTISISPNGSTEAWLAAFGFLQEIEATGSNSSMNKAMVTGIIGPLTPEMTRNSAQINGTADAPIYEWAYLASKCENLIQAPVFVGWDTISSVGNYFGLRMFYHCYNLSTLPVGFNLPRNVSEVGHGFASEMFKECRSLATLPTGFNLPQGINKAGNDFVSSLFSNCESLQALPNGFNFPQQITFADNVFAEKMFENCTSLTLLPNGFTLPQKVTVVGYSFAREMFAGCSSLNQLPNGFNLPQGIIETGDVFLGSMFRGCTGLTALPSGFNLPPGIIKVGTHFAAGMFDYCTSLAGLPNGFNLPQSLTMVGDYFAASMFFNCVSLTNLPSGFNLPQGITSAGDYFAVAMLHSCTNLTGLPSGFNLPQGITSAGVGFAYQLLYMTGGTSFQINDELVLPVGIPASTEDAYRQAFRLFNSAPTQNRTAASIIGSSPTPDSQRETFGSHFRDIEYIPINWGGDGHEKPGAGAPGSGDLWGTGTVTIDIALVVARVVTGG